MFLDEIRALSSYWARPERDATLEQRLDGLAFSILAALDGCTSLPAFKVIPLPHPSDRAYHESDGENWWPDDLDIGGSLHDEWHRPTVQEPTP